MYILVSTPRFFEMKQLVRFFILLTNLFQGNPEGRLLDSIYMRTLVVITLNTVRSGKKPSQNHYLVLDVGYFTHHERDC